jgi:hypothetical protein
MGSFTLIAILVPGGFTPKYLRDLSTQAEEALIFFTILSRIEAGIEKVYNKTALV